MFNRKNLALLVVGGSLAALPVLAQNGETYGKSEASVQAFGSWVRSTTDNGVGQSASNSGGVLASYRFFFTHNQGVEVNYGYSLNTQSYQAPTGSLGVRAGQHEVTAAYVYRHQMHALTPFVEAGVGGLIFDPTNAPGASTQARAAFVYGAGADINLAKRLFLRAEYRGLIYDSPTFGIAPGLERYTHRAEPSVGFGYRF